MPRPAARGVAKASLTPRSAARRGAKASFTPRSAARRGAKASFTPRPAARRVAKASLTPRPAARRGAKASFTLEEGGELRSRDFAEADWPAQLRHGGVTGRLPGCAHATSSSVRHGPGRADPAQAAL